MWYTIYSPKEIPPRVYKDRKEVIAMTEEKLQSIIKEIEELYNELEKIKQELCKISVEIAE